MKKITFLLLQVLYFLSYSQVITIPDINFKNRLLMSNTTNSIAKDIANNNVKIDANSNNEIEITEALNVYYLNLQSSNISNITGIGFFTNLIDLNCAANYLTEVDFSSLINLRVFRCDGNQITNLNLTNLVELRYLACGNNNISNLDLSSQVNLGELFCQNLFLTNLNLSDLINLRILYCPYNLISNINFGQTNNLRQLICNNNYIQDLYLSNFFHLSHVLCYNNPELNSIYMKIGSPFDADFLFNLNLSNCHNLSYVCVDDYNINSIQDKIDFYGYANCLINSNCNLSINQNNFEKIDIYPNPVKSNLFIVIEKSMNILSINIYDALGQVVLSEINPQNNLNVSNLKSGNYFIKVITDKGVSTAKFIKE